MTWYIIKPEAWAAFREERGYSIEPPPPQPAYEVLVDGKVRLVWPVHAWSKDEVTCVEATPIETTLTKTTVLEGHYATGDCEAFVWDTHPNPEYHSEEWNKWWDAHRGDPIDEDTPIPEGLLDDACRVYPDALMPDGVKGRKGRWRITIEFEPLD